MLGARHLPTYLDSVNFEIDLEKHHKKLGQIQNGQAKRKPIYKDESAKLVQSRSQNLKFHNSEKHLAIEKDNELLLGRLVEISRKKQNPIFAVNESVKDNKSLNSNFRKREKDRIAAENEAFARRLLSQQPSFNRQKLDNDYEKHTGRVRLMQKWVPFSPRIKLPPIKYDKYEEIDRKSQSGKEKRAIKDINKKKRRKSQKIGKATDEERAEITEVEERQEEEVRRKEEEEISKQEEAYRKEQEAEEKAAKEQADKLKREQEEKVKKDQEEKAKKEQEEKVKREQEEKLKKEQEQKTVAQNQQQSPKTEQPQNK